MGQNGSAPIPPEAQMAVAQNSIHNFNLSRVKKEPSEITPVGAPVGVLQTPPSNNDNKAVLEPLKMQMVKMEPSGYNPAAANVHHAPLNDNNEAIIDPVKKQNVKMETIGFIPDAADDYQAPPSNDDNEAVLESVKKQKKEKKKQNTASKRGRPKYTKPPAALEEHHDTIAPNAILPPIDDNQQPVVADVKVHDATSITSMNDAPLAKRVKRGSWEYVPSEPRLAYPKVTNKRGDRQARELAKLAMDIVDSQHDLTKAPEEWYIGSEFDHNKPISMADRIKNNRRCREIRHYSPPGEKTDQKKVKVNKVVKPPAEKKKRTRKPRGEKPMKVAKPPKENKVKRSRSRRPPKREETPVEDTESQSFEDKYEDDDEEEESSCSRFGYYDNHSVTDEYVSRRAERRRSDSEDSQDNSSIDFRMAHERRIEQERRAEQSSPTFSLSDGMPKGDMEDDPFLAPFSAAEIPPGCYGYSSPTPIEPMELPEKILDDRFYEEEEEVDVEKEDEKETEKEVQWLYFEEEVDVEEEEKKELNNNSLNALVERRLPSSELINSLDGGYTKNVGVYYNKRLLIIHPINKDTSMDKLISALEKEKDLWFIPTLRPTDTVRGNVAVILPSSRAARKMLDREYMDVNSGCLTIHIHQPGAIFLKPVDPNDRDYLQGDHFLRDHLDSIIGQILHIHKHGDGWVVLIASRDYARDLIMIGIINGAKITSFKGQGVNKHLIKWPVVDVEWARELGMRI